MRHSLPLSRFAPVLLLSAGLAGPLAAQGLEEVIVTAQKRQETLQEAPISLSVLDASALETARVSDLSDIEGLVPNLEITPFPNSKSTLVLFIRGIGNNESQITQDPAVGVYIDGIYMGRSVGLASDVAGLERIEVLRGPQGTLYGRNTTGGAINLISTKPAGEFGFEQTVGVGNFGSFQSRSLLDTGETAGGLSARISVLIGEQGGWVDNTTRRSRSEAPGQGGEDFGFEEKVAARVALRWQASDDVVLDYSYDNSSVEGPQMYYQIVGFNEDVFQAAFAGAITDTAVRRGVGDAYNAAVQTDLASAGGWTGAANRVPNSESNVDGHGLTVTWERDFGELKYLLGVRSLDETLTQDYSGDSGLPTFHVRNVSIEQEQMSHELQLVASALDDRLDYVAGLYYFAEDGFEDELTGVSSATVSHSSAVENRRVRMDNTALAVYGQATWHFTDRLSLTVGARYTQDERDASKDFRPARNDVMADPSFAGVTLSGEESFSNFNPSLVLNVQWNDELSTYFKYVTAYKSGGFNLRGDQEDFSTPYTEENVTTLEAGLKSEWLDRRLRINAAVFSNAFDDLQIQQVPDVTRLSQTRVLNAAEASISGFELDLTYQPIEALRIGFSYGYLDTKFDSFVDNFYDPTFSGTVTPTDVSSQAKLTYAPESSYNLDLKWRIGQYGPMTLSAAMNYNYRDEHYGGAYNADLEGFLIRDYGLLNASVNLDGIQLGTGELAVSLWGKNIADEEYHAHTVTFGFIRTAAFGAPATMGLDLSYRY